MKAIIKTLLLLLLPTPMKSHYTFNLSRPGVSITRLAKEINAKDAFASLWCHEAMRVFHDRLINDHDRDWFVADCPRVVPRLGLDLAAVYTASSYVR